MRPDPIVDPLSIADAPIILDLAGIQRINAHRFEFQQLDAVTLIDTEKHIIVGYKQLQLDEFWVRGHLPGFPLMPGVLMLEAAAQLCSVYVFEAKISDKVIGLGGFDEVRFRAAVKPGDKLVLMCSGDRLNRRACIFNAQGFVGSTMVFHAKIHGLPIAERGDVFK